MHKISDHVYLKINKMVNLSLFISIAIVLSIFEAFIPFSYVLPGFKLGLSNIMLILIVPYYSFRELLVFQVVKITISNLILGLLSVYLFSLSGGLLSLCMIYSSYQLFRGKISGASLSVIGAISHNLGQLMFAMFYLNTFSLFYYLLFMVVAASITGLFNGWIIMKIKPSFDRNYDD